MTAPPKRIGPTRIWKTIKGKSVKTSDGKDIGEIKKISENYLLVQQGRVHKHSFWIPKYVADAFDGKALWLLLSEDEVRGKYQYGIKPPTQENYVSEFERFRKTPYGQKINYASDFNENIRVVENYSNIRDLQSAPQTEISGPVKKEIDRPREVDGQEKNKDAEILKRETNRSAKYYNKQPIYIDFPGTVNSSVQPVVMDKPTESEDVEVKKKNVNISSSTSSSPIRLSTSHTTQEKYLEDMDRDRDIDRKRLSFEASPVRITSNEPPTRPTISTPTSTLTTIGKPENVSPNTLPLSPSGSQKNKETDSSPAVLEINSTKAEEKSHDDIIKTNTQSTPMTIAPTTSIVSDKDTDIQPVLSELTQPMVEVRPEEQQIVPASKKNEELSLDLTTTALKSTSIEEPKPTSTSLVPAANPDQSNQISLYDEGHIVIGKNENKNENVNPG